MKKKKLIPRIIIILIGQFLIGAACSMGIISNLGVDPASVFELGLAGIFHISYGTAMSLTNLIILLVVLVVDRHYINIATATALVMVGFSADLTNAFFAAVLPEQLGMPARVIFMLLGCVVMSYGIAMYIRTDLGVGAVDLIAEIFSDKTKIPYKWARIGGDVAFVVVGFFLGGTVGVGTVVTAFLIGPIVSWVRPGVFRIIDPLIDRKSDPQVAEGQTSVSEGLK